MTPKQYAKQYIENQDDEILANFLNSLIERFVKAEGKERKHLSDWPFNELRKLDKEWREFVSIVGICILREDAFGDIIEMGLLLVQSFGLERYLERIKKELI